MRISEIAPAGRGKNFPRYPQEGKKSEVHGEGFGAIFEQELRKLQEDKNDGKRISDDSSERDLSAPGQSKKGPGGFIGAYGIYQEEGCNAEFDSYSRTLRGRRVEG